MFVTHWNKFNEGSIKFICSPEFQVNYSNQVFETFAVGINIITMKLCIGTNIGQDRSPAVLASNGNAAVNVEAVPRDVIGGGVKGKEPFLTGRRRERWAGRIDQTTECACARACACV